MPDYKTSLATIELLAEQFPQCFVMFEKRRRPLKLGIHTDVLAASDITPAVLSAALKAYVGNAAYLQACTEGAPRIGLDGNIAGSVSAEEAANAKRRLEQQLARRKRYRDAAAEARAKAESEARNAGRISLEGLRAAAQARRNQSMTGA